MENKTKEIYMYFLGALVFLSALADSILLIFYEVPAGSRDVVMVATGQLLGLAVVVVNYFFGSSKSSSDKTELLNKKESVNG